MTREEILAMPAGRELDALVAEKVMGGRRESIQTLAPMPKEYWNFSDTNQPWVDDWKTSEHISAAFEVMEQFKGKGWLFTLKNLVGGEYTFSLTDWNGKCNTYIGQGDTAPLAICRAALLTTMEETP